MENVASEILIILVLILANGFFAASEIAIVSARRGRLEAKAHQGNEGAKIALHLSEKPDRFLATVQVGITLIGTFSAAFGGARIADSLAVPISTIPALAPYAETLALTLVVIVITYLSLVLGELVPKRLALRSAEQFASFAAPIMNTLSWVLRPLVALLSVSVSFIVRLFGKAPEENSGVTEEDIVYMVRAGEVTGGVETAEAELIQRVFQFADMPIRAIMTPRPDITSIPSTLPLNEIATIFHDSGFTRIPVYEHSPDNIIGILNAKDLLKILIEQHPFQIKTVMRPPEFVVEGERIGIALARFRGAGTHLGLVIDEYGQVVGLVTLEDILEELVGEIRDEYDAETHEAILQRADGSWLVEGGEAYDKVVSVIGLPKREEDEEGDFTTLAGMIIARLNRIPSSGDIVTIPGFTLEVVDMDGRRVDKVLVTPQPKESNKATKSGKIEPVEPDSNEPEPPASETP